MATKEKPPRRLEVLTAIISVLVGLQVLGIIDIIKDALRRWLIGE